MCLLADVDLMPFVVLVVLGFLKVNTIFSRKSATRTETKPTQATTTPGLCRGPWLRPWKLALPVLVPSRVVCWFLLTIFSGKQKDAGPAASATVSKS